MSAWWDAPMTNGDWVWITLIIPAAFWLGKTWWQGVR